MREWKHTETSSGSDANETGNDAGAETENAEFTLEDVVEGCPSEAASTGCKVGVDDYVDTSDGEVGGGCTCRSC